MGQFAQRLPGSQPGTIFGFPLAKLRDPSFVLSMLFIAGVVLLVTLFLPVATKPKTMFVWDFPDKFKSLIWPLLVGAVYVGLAKAPAQALQGLPPVVTRSAAFVLAGISVFVFEMGMPGMKAETYALGLASMIVGLTVLADDNDSLIGRIVVGVGSLFFLIFFIDIIDFAFKTKHMPGLLVLHNILWFIVTIVGVACAAFAVPTSTVPALAPLKDKAPLALVVFLAWAPLQVLLFGIVFMTEFKMGAGGFFILLHLLGFVVAVHGVLFLTSLQFTDAMKNLTTPTAGGGYPPQGGGGYPPQGGGGYPPQGGGGYPPQGGGYPPQGGGGYPPPQGGGGYPPPQG